MKITKLGHCCMLIEDKGVRILTDPGSYSTAQNDVRNIDIVLITHEHPDHLHMDSLSKVLLNSPQAIIFTNKSVGKILDNEKISHDYISDGEYTVIGDVVIEGYGKKHADIHASIPCVENTGYCISHKFFYPGDAFFIPKKNVEILALPVAGPWMKLSEAIQYALDISPKKCFGVHDGMLKILGLSHILPQKVLCQEGIDFMILEEQKEYNFN